MKRWLVIPLLALASSAAAQEPIIVGDGFEAFPGVEYRGGDARFSKQVFGVLILTDSSLAFHQCTPTEYYACHPRGDDPFWKAEPLFVVPLAALREVQVSSRVRDATAGSKLLLGIFAGDREEEYIGFVHETVTSAEAPVFRTMKTQAGAIEAKVRYRMEKLGLELRP